MQYNIRSLQVFECVYRHSSLTLAAEELSITPSAVSHQLRNLKAQIGEDLVVKQGRAIFFTERGRQLAESLKYAFSEIDASVRNGVSGSERQLRVTMCSCFGLGWFIPKLMVLGEAKWKSQLQLKMYSESTEISDTNADIFFSTIPLKSGYWSAKVADENLVAVSSLDCKSALLITHDVSDRNFGEDWLAFANLSDTKFTRATDRNNIIGCSHYIFALGLACSGYGTALVPEFLAEAMIKDKKLTLASNRKLPSGRSYYINVKYSRRHEPLISEFCAWIIKLARLESKINKDTLDKDTSD